MRTGLCVICGSLLKLYCEEFSRTVNISLSLCASVLMRRLRKHFTLSGVEMNYFRFAAMNIGLVSSVFFSQAQADTVENGGEILKGMIERCDIVGIGSANGGARYALRKISPSDIEKVGDNYVVIRNLSESELKTYSVRPKRIALFLGNVDRDESGAITRYYISGRFSNGPVEDGRPLLEGTLSEIAFSPNDKLQVTYNNQFRFRGQMKTRLFTPGDVGGYSSEGTSGWDLAIPETFTKEAICASRDTAGRDTIFIN
jgi:hypothetical protein